MAVQLAFDSDGSFEKCTYVSILPVVKACHEGAHFVQKRNSPDVEIQSTLIVVDQSGVVSYEKGPGSIEVCPGR